jgi:DNA-binding NtrC family response regulator
MADVGLVPDEAPVPRPRLLLVDDDFAVLRTVGRQLAPLFEVICANDASEAMDRLAELEFEVVLTDYNMPGMHGLDLLEAVQRRWPRVQRVLMTAHASVEAAPAIVDRLLLKPFATSDLEMLLSAESLA